MSWSDLLPAVFGLLGVALGSGVSAWVQRSDRHARLSHELELESLRRQDWIDQQWWQRKADTYGQVMEALWQLRASAQEDLNHLELIMDGSIDQGAKISDRDWRANNERIKRAAQIGEFVVSREVADSISGYLSAHQKLLNNQEDFYEMVSTDLDLLDACMDEVRRGAMSDLRLNRT